jgi:hypothetical protein
MEKVLKMEVYLFGTGMEDCGDKAKRRRRLNMRPAAGSCGKAGPQTAVE